MKVKEAEGALLDATIVTSAVRPKKTVEPDNTAKQSADPDTSWVKKGKQNYFDYERRTERVGFEPTVLLRVRVLSRDVPSATQPSFLKKEEYFTDLILFSNVF